MGPGFSRMNHITVQLATQGVAQYLTAQSSGQSKSVIIGHDHRHNSTAFAEIVAQTLHCAGIKVKIFSHIVPTPMVPFAVAHERADFGIMITASHNPAADNGYKVFGANGCQIMGPVDTTVAALIKGQKYQLWKLSKTRHQQDDPTLYERTAEAYISSIITLFHPLLQEYSSLPQPPIVYTPMHGVGLSIVRRLIEKCGLLPIEEVPSQKEPNPDFPTVKFPNPEEGLPTLAKAISHAESLGITLVFANDPDADRFNLAEQRGGSGPWRVFTGNEIAALLTDFLWRHRKALYKNVDQFYVLNSCVSSKFLRAMGLKEGFAVLETLTGFKHLSNASQSLERASNQRNKVLLAYEEAIGFMINTEVWDKDGISALLAMYLVVIETQSEGCSIGERLEALYTKYGYFCQYNSYYYCENPSKIALIFDQVRCKLEGRLSEPRKTDLTGPAGIREAGVTIEKIQDFPGSSMVTLYLDPEGLSWITLRASGTEPKVKFYSELRCELAEQAQGKQDLIAIVQKICNWLLDPEVNGLSIQGSF